MQVAFELLGKLGKISWLPIAGLVFARLLPIVAFTPIFGGSTTPRRYRAGLSILLALTLTPLLLPAQIQDGSGATYVALLAKEALVGLTIAVFIRVLFEMVAALGPQALKVTGRMADGTTLAWVGPRTVREHIKPRLTEAASAADRPSPRIIATLPICVTDDEQRVRALISRTLTMYAELPSYKAMFEREGVAEPGDLALVGSASRVSELVAELAEAGVTDYAASEFTTNRQEREQTRELLKTLI